MVNNNEILLRGPDGPKKQNSHTNGDIQTPPTACEQTATLVVTASAQDEVCLVAQNVQTWNPVTSSSRCDTSDSSGSSSSSDSESDNDSDQSTCDHLELPRSILPLSDYEIEEIEGRTGPDTTINDNDHDPSQNRANTEAPRKMVKRLKKHHRTIKATCRDIRRCFESTRKNRILNQLKLLCKQVRSAQKDEVSSNRVCEAKWKSNEDRWYRCGKWTLNHDGTYDVVFADGDLKKGVLPSEIRIPPSYVPETFWRLIFYLAAVSKEHSNGKFRRKIIKFSEQFHQDNGYIRYMHSMSSESCEYLTSDDEQNSQDFRTDDPQLQNEQPRSASMALQLRSRRIKYKEDPDFTLVQKDAFREVYVNTGRGIGNRVVIRLQKLKRRKWIVIVSGLDAALDLRRILKQLKKQLACNGCIKHESMPDGSVANILHVQGNHQQGVFDFLVGNDIVDREQVVLRG